MKLLVGLGNPGEEYEATRHNVGFLVAEEFRRRHGGGREGRRAQAFVSRVRMGAESIFVARPLTFMNRSGAAVAALLAQVDAEPRDLLVVCDDLYLDFGVLRLKARGSHGGHKGLRSIMEMLGTQAFPRLRIGVGPAPAGTTHADYVLSQFRRAEARELPSVVEAAVNCVEVTVLEGLEAAMNRFNRSASPKGDEAEGR
ncbi:MAG TPA: aminoacyl-tRNA hydrolase [Candidatus Polarisedimenticolia bacterium]|nr:aminoacyl-tRNA hydrolase [Candidatus Polarisedimenticolia bacterium]